MNEQSEKGHQFEQVQEIHEGAIDLSEGTSYNPAMNKEAMKDKSLTEELVDSLAFSSGEFAPDQGRRKKPSQKPVLSADEKELMIQREQKREFDVLEARKKRAEKRPSIVESSEAFLFEYQKIIKGYIKGAKFPRNNEKVFEHADAKKALDLLLKRGYLDEEILRSWMHHTAKSLLQYSKGAIKVKFMLTQWESFQRRGLPSQEVISRNKKLKAESEAIRKDMIGMSMSKLFSEGISAVAVSMSCQFWGITMTAEYISRKIGQEKAYDEIVSCFDSKNGDEINSIMSITAKYEKFTGGMYLDDWRTQFSVILNVIGKLEEYESRDVERDAVAAFSDGLSRSKA